MANLAFALGAVASATEVGVTGADRIAAAGLFVLLGSATVIVPLTFFLVTPERARGTLDSVSAFMVRNTAVIMMVILAFLGLNLLGGGEALSGGRRGESGGQAFSGWRSSGAGR